MYDRSYQSQILKEKKPKEVKPKNKLKLFLVIIGGMIFLGGMVYLLTIPPLQIRQITISGTNVVDPNEVEQFIKNGMEGKYAFIIPKTSTVFFNTKRVEKRVLTAFPRIASITISRTRADVIEVSVTEYEGTYLWCMTTKENCYFMDETGVVFSEAPYFSGSAYERIYGGEKKELPFSPLSSEVFSIVKQYLEQLPQVAITPTAVVYDSSYKLVITFSHNNQDAELLINPTQSIDVVMQNIGTAMHSEPFRTEFNDHTKKLHYIDSRFSNKIVYKFN